MTPTTALTLAEPRTLAEGANVRDLAKAWKDSLALQVRAGEIAETTQRTYEIGLEKFLTWADRRKLVSDEVIREWIADMRGEGRTPATVNTWLAGVRSFFSWAFRNRHLPYNPTNGLKGAKRSGTSQKHKRDALTDREVLRVIGAPDVSTPEGKRDRAILALMAYCGARSVELQRADLADLRTVGGRLVLDVRGKGRQEKDELLVIAHPDAESAVRDWLGERGSAAGPLFVSLSHRSHGARLSLMTIRYIVKSHFKAAGVRGDRKTTHSLRHTAITSAVKHGAPVQKVQTMARHANISTTMIYYHETDRVENPAEAFVNYDAKD
jgi:integrase/recombinase XerD